MIGPNNGPAHGRFRTTMQERLHNKAQPFPLSPVDSVSLATRGRDLRFQNRVTMASLGQQAQGVKDQYRMLRSQAIGQGQSALSDVQGDVEDRGLAGSSVQVAGEQGVYGATQQDIGEAYLARTQALGDINMQRLASITGTRLGLGDLALERAARKRQLALAAFGSGGQNPWGF